MDEVRERMHALWASVAPGWEQHADFIDHRGAAMTARLLDMASPQPGERVLELACGPGGLGLAAAGRVGPGGEVVLSDVAAEMTAIAAARAAELGLGNVTTRELDIEEIAEPDASFDAVLCREGLMFAVDPARGAAEIRRVLRPGGRVAIAVWGPRERNPWLGIVLDAVSDHVGAPIPPPGVPGPFSLSDADGLEELLTGAGLEEVVVAEEEAPMGAGSFEEWWTRTVALAGPLAAILASMPVEAADAIRERARAAAGPYATAEGGLEFPGVTLVGVGRS